MLAEVSSRSLQKRAHVDDTDRLVGLDMRDEVGQQHADGYPLRAQALSQVQRLRGRNHGVVPAVQ